VYDLGPLEHRLWIQIQLGWWVDVHIFFFPLLLVFLDCTAKVEAVQWVDTLLKESCRISEKYSSFQKFIMNLNMPEGKTCVG